jgi:serine/threonine protein kinase
MHDDGYFHRYLKPSDILIKAHSSRWWVRIGDLGISKRTEKGTPLQTYTGTPDFLAPDVLVQIGFLHCPSLIRRG